MQSTSEHTKASARARIETAWKRAGRQVPENMDLEAFTSALLYYVDYFGLRRAIDVLEDGGMDRAAGEEALAELGITRKYIRDYV